jgi:two-component sensor histidine kinase
MMNVSRTDVEHPTDRTKRMDLSSEEFVAGCLRGASELPGIRRDDEPRSSTHRLMRRIEKLEAEIARRQLLLLEAIRSSKNTLQLAATTLGAHIDVVHRVWIRRDLRSIQKQLRNLFHIHHRFYAPTNADTPNLNFRQPEICSSIFESFGERSGQIALSVAVAEIQLQRHQEIGLCLMLQELLTNALKHAIPCARRGTITVNFDADDQSILSPCCTA